MFAYISIFVTHLCHLCNIEYCCVQFHTSWFDQSYLGISLMM